MTETQTPTQSAIDRVLALKAARLAELAATESRRQQEERAAEADAAAFEQALSEVLSSNYATWLLSFRDTEARYTHASPTLFQVKFVIPGHQPVAVMLSKSDDGYEPASQLWWTGRRSWDLLADALIAAEEIPY